jgi:exopolysaccharide biosynthesis WecB/TagA/CpsF family protein
VTPGTALNATGAAAVLPASAAALSSKPFGAEVLEVMGMRYWDAGLTDVARYIVGKAAAGERLQVFFVNAHCVNVAARDPAYAHLLHKSPFLFADGAGMALAARLSGVALKHNVNGTDLFPQLCAEAAARGVPVAFLGARPSIAATCAAQMEKRYPGLKVVWVADGYLSADEESRQLQSLNTSGAKLLFVAKGVPAQEHWIASHADALTTPVVLGVGALFDFYSGAISRAPKFLRALRLEWLYRLLREPRRMFRRYVIGNPEFVLRALWWRLRH